MLLFLLVFDTPFLMLHHVDIGVQDLSTNGIKNPSKALYARKYIDNLSSMIEKLWLTHRIKMQLKISIMF